MTRAVTFFGESFQKPVMQYDVKDEIRKILNGQ